jgi:hypothetical protein
LSYFRFAMLNPAYAQLNRKPDLSNASVSQQNHLFFSKWMP